MKNLNWLLILAVLCKKLSMVATQRRSLIFPPTAPTRAQLIYGIGIPLELETESLTTGYVLKTEYFLPTKAEEFRPTMLHPQSINKRNVNFNETLVKEELQSRLDERRKLKNNTKLLSKYRWAVYRGIEMIAERMGLVGKACMLRSICEAANVPFHYQSGILGELMHIIITPSSSVDIVEKPADYSYFQAEMFGKSGAPCYKIFKECEKSLIEYFSGIFDYTNKPY